MLSEGFKTNIARKNANMKACCFIYKHNQKKNPEMQKKKKIQRRTNEYSI